MRFPKDRPDITRLLFLIGSAIFAAILWAVQVHVGIPR